jgi:hypothetical protein
MDFELFFLTFDSVIQRIRLEEPVEYTSNTSTMKTLLISLLFLGAWNLLHAQNPVKPKPAFCDQPPNSYNYSAPGPAPKPLPVFPTSSQVEYRVQVAVLRNTDPRTLTFHPSLVARYQPCEEVWIVESRETFKDRALADKLKGTLEKAGYPTPFVTTIISYN